MTKKQKRVAALLSNPNGLRFEDACLIAEQCGFKLKNRTGSHWIYGREDEPTILNFQNRNGLVKPYQAIQLLAMVQRYANTPTVPD